MNGRPAAAGMADPAHGQQGQGLSFALGQARPPALLYRRVDPADLPFDLCSELEAAPGLIGQERAVEALEFAVRIRGKGYNVYALGAGGTGRHTIIQDLPRPKATNHPTPPARRHP